MTRLMRNGLVDRDHGLWEYAAAKAFGPLLANKSVQDEAAKEGVTIATIAARYSMKAADTFVVEMERYREEMRSKDVAAEFVKDVARDLSVSAPETQR